MLRMSTLVALFVLLLSYSAFGAEGPGGSGPQVIDTETPAQLPFSNPEPDKNSIDSAAEIEIQRRFNELRHEFLEDRREFLYDRAENVDWWLTATAILLALVGVVAVFAGYFGLKRFDDIKTEALKNAEEAKAEISRNAEEAKAEISRNAEEARRLLGEIKETRDNARKYLEELNAEAVSKDLEKAAATAESVQRDPAASVISRAIAAAVRLQEQERIEEAIETWRSIANIVEDRQLQAQAWFSIGYLSDEGDGTDFEASLDAYTKAIELNPVFPMAYNNRGVMKNALRRYEDALADFDRAIELNPAYGTAYCNRGLAKEHLGRINEARAAFQQALDLGQKTGDEDLVTKAKDNLSRLDNNAES